MRRPKKKSKSKPKSIGAGKAKNTQPLGRAVRAKSGKKTRAKPANAKKKAPPASAAVRGLGNPAITSRRPERHKPVLLIQHSPHEHAAAVERALESQGIPTRYVHPYKGEAFPKPSELSGLVSLGGPMSANDDGEFPWLLKECELLRRAVAAGLPTVGICLGGQLLARALGGSVETHHTAEIGWFPIFLNREGLSDPIAGAAGACPTVYHWHGDTFHPPKDAVLLAGSRVCERQIYRIGESVYGFQFHPEADHQLVLEWLDDHAVGEQLRDAQKTHGIETIQDPVTMRQASLKGEKGSLKITAAIASLFRRRPYEPVAREFVDRLPEWMTQRAPLLLEFLSADRKLVQLIGTIETLLTIPAGVYVIFQDENTLLWPVRLDDVVRMAPAR